MQSERNWKNMPNQSSIGNRQIPIGNNSFLVSDFVSVSDSSNMRNLLYIVEKKIRIHQLDWWKHNIVFIDGEKIVNDTYGKGAKINENTRSHTHRSIQFLLQHPILFNGIITNNNNNKRMQTFIRLMLLCWLVGCFSDSCAPFSKSFWSLKYHAQICIYAMFKYFFLPLPFARFLFRFSSLSLLSAIDDRSIGCPSVILFWRVQKMDQPRIF